MSPYNEIMQNSLRVYGSLGCPSTIHARITTGPSDVSDTFQPSFSILSRIRSDSDQFLFLRASSRASTNASTSSCFNLDNAFECWESGIHQNSGRYHILASSPNLGRRHCHSYLQASYPRSRSV